MYCNNCGNEIEPGGRFCQSCGAAAHPTAREVAPVAESQRGPIQPESFSGNREGHRRPHPSENATGRNSRDHFSARVPKKGLFLVGAGILVLVAGLAGGYWWMHRAPAVTSGDDIVIEKETPAPKEEKQAEQQAPAPAPEKPAPVRKAVKRASKPAPKASAPRNEPWKYRVEAPAPKPQAQPAPKAQAQARGNIIGDILGTFTGPAPDVTPPSSDPRDLGR